MGFFMKIKPWLYTNPTAAVVVIELNIIRLIQDEATRRMEILQYLNSELDFQKDKMGSADKNSKKLFENSKNSSIGA